jgi:hypothetical protein
MAEIIRPKSTGEEVLVKIVNQMVFVRNETPILDPNGDGRTFTTNYEYVPHTLCVTLNGLRQREGIEYDYEELGGNRFRFNHSIEEEDSVIVDYIKVMNITG